MIQDIAGELLVKPVNAALAGDNTVVAAQAGSWIYIYELIGDLSGAATLTTKSGTIVLDENFALTTDQGITLSALANLANVPRYKIPPGNDFIINLAPAASFIGGCAYAYRS